MPWQCERQCRRSDAWRCAVDQRLTGQIACHCPCHRYIEREVEELDRQRKQSQEPRDDDNQLRKAS